MDEHKFKQRIVGAIVLVALAVIFIPMLLSGKRDDVFRDFDEVIPAKPDALKDIKVLELENPIPPPVPHNEVVTPVDETTAKAPPATRKLAKPAKPAKAEVKAPAQTHSATAAPVAGKPAKKPTARAWAVQVGSFSKRNNAMRLRDKLRKAGYRAYVEKVSTAKGVVYRVRVGPEIKRSRAESRRKAIDEKFNLKGIVVSHP